MNLETHPQGDVHDTLRPPEISSFDEVPVRWHPKITVYRLIVLLTTICLGVGKAIMSAKGAVVVSVTLEWVSGVAVFVLLYCVGLYDEDRQQHMKCLFNKDLAPYLWLVSYRTDEVGLPAGFHLSQHPPITGYRIVVTASVLLFGLAKAMLGYLGHPVAANTFDWTYGVVVTSGFYCIGLYENNSLDLFSAFFTIDYGPFLRRVFLAIHKYSPSIVFFLGVVYAAVRILAFQWSHPVTLTFVSVDPHMKMSFFDYVHDLCLNLLISEILLLIAALGVSGLFNTLYSIKKAVLPRGIRWAIRGTLNVSGAEELPPPYYGRNPDKNVNIAKYILRVFALVFAATLTTVTTRWAFWITGEVFVGSTSWWMVPLYVFLTMPY
ncbi:hypothetical protein K443DRAFT_679418 [Laccaria amethystina LaAM-08-1]|uniref:Uncharacterized protein n=1 Tax=Laccaria amethystina LaAM-08-1 TaxID=1095629 RepID=A0A0C9WPW6_9AGAR|nr:hypothetical protein K443DRAFT_679418 [Laccaria amethystina LaAM-08-1]